MQTYVVGGAVRDMLLGNKPKDVDYVVVGATAKQMSDAGFERVGADFPVFLHPETGDEYALARTERSTGDGYHDFTFETENVTLEDDLRRRDLTINAMAAPSLDIDIDKLIDPFGGLSDLSNKVLRHVDDAGFAEDPLRVLRLARFAARYADFSINHKTTNLCRKMVQDGMLATLTPERIAKEMEKALNEWMPSRFFIFLRMVGALEVVFPELHALTEVPAGSYLHHPEGDAFTHTMMVMEAAKSLVVADMTKSGDAGFPIVPVTLFCALVHDLGKGTTDRDLLPKHYGHEARGVPLVEAMCDRLKLANEYRRYGTRVANYHTHVHNTFVLNAKTIVEMHSRLKTKQNRMLPYVLTLVSCADAQGRGSFYANTWYPNRFVMQHALSVCEINASDVCTEQELQNVNVLQNKLLHAKTTAVREVVSKWKDVLKWSS